MENNKNLLLALGLSIAILLGWQFLMPSSKPLPPVQQQTTGGEATPSAGGTTAPATTATDAAPLVRPLAEVLAETQRTAIDGPRLDGSINLTGGQIDDLTLKDYRETLDPTSPEILLLSPRGTPHPYYVGVRWLSASGAPVPGADTIWTAEGGPLALNAPVTLTATLGDLTYQIVYAIDANYMITATQRVTNNGAAAVEVAPYALINRTGIPPRDTTYIVHEGMYGVLGDRYEEVGYKDLEDVPNATISKDTTGGWLGFTDKYWAVLLVPDQDVPVKARYVYNRTAAGDVFQSDVTYPSQTIEPGQSQESVVRFFAGARQPKIIDAYNDDLKIDRFYLGVDYGWIFFLSRPIYLVLEWFHGLVGNFGVAILLLVVCVRILLFPLANKAYKSMAKMRKLQPKMVELRERYKDDRAKFQQEIMGLYKKEGANPVAGCLPLLVQIPIFIALYNVLYGTIEMRHAPFFGWIQDLSAPDPTSWINLFGLLPFDVPHLGILHFFSLGVWPLIMGTTMFLQYRLNPQPTDPIQAKLFAFMPVIFTFMLGQFASGLVIYWAWNNTLSMLQQVYIMRRQGIPLGRSAQAAHQAAEKEKAKAEIAAQAALPPKPPAPKALKKPDPKKPDPKKKR